MPGSQAAAPGVAGALGPSVVVTGSGGQQNVLSFLLQIMEISFCLAARFPPFISAFSLWAAGHSASTRQGDLLDWVQETVRGTGLG